ncbi:MarR family winged helix-turn-helix transcriptional regulator [Streptomyces sp. SAS_270]|uniref:MarR family winged helix-turn-helix transcriptional regulator n=1 Tax=Streptomyces sp. SAS_270 TaxID=3412748 RepID=UPI00403C0F14
MHHPLPSLSSGPPTPPCRPSPRNSRIWTSPRPRSTLANLADGHGRTVSELGAAVGTRPTTLTSVLDRLERRGHISRGARSGDRRAVLVELTPSGRRTAARIRQAFTDLEHHALAALPAETVTALRTALQALTEVSS